MKTSFFVLALVTLAMLVACNMRAASPEPTTDNADLVATMVELTLAEVPTLTPVSVAQPTTTPALVEPSPTPSSNLGTVTGKICYPASASGDVSLYFQDSSTGEATSQPVNGSASSYSASLKPGAYIAYYWFNSFAFGANYTGCTSQATCPSDAPKPFTLTAGQTLSGIDFCDLTHGPFDVPYPPGVEQQQTVGSVTGTISYPYGSIPQLTVVAFSQTTPYWYWVGTASGQSYYTVPGLPPGQYQVVAYDGSGHAGGSVVVTVTAGGSVTADVADWGGSYPANPVK